MFPCPHDRIRKTSRNIFKMLHTLPAELQNQVVEQLGYIDAIRLSQVNNHFHSIVDPQQWPTEQKVAEIHEAEPWEKHNRVYFANRFDKDNLKKLVVVSDGVACFGCFRVREKSHFARIQVERQGAKRSYTYVHLGHRRLCIDCALFLGICGPGTLLHIASGQTWIVSNGVMGPSDKTITRLLVCGDCGQACEFVAVCPLESCSGCEEIKTQVDASAIGKEMMNGRKRGYQTVECVGCHGITDIRIEEKMLRCEGCDESICKKCFSAKLPDCKCQEPEDPVCALRWMFNSVEEVKERDGDLLNGDESGLMEILSLDV